MLTMPLTGVDLRTALVHEQVNRLIGQGRGDRDPTSLMSDLESE